MHEVANPITSGLPGVLAQVHDRQVFRSQKRRSGQCFPLALFFVDEHDDWTLVHGTLTSFVVMHFKETFHHAWAVKDSMLYEPLHNRIYYKPFYETICHPIVSATYDRKEARRLAVKFEHYGPWDGSV